MTMKGAESCRIVFFPVALISNCWLRNGVSGMVIFAVKDPSGCAECGAHLGRMKQYFDRLLAAVPGTADGDDRSGGPADGDRTTVALPTGLKLSKNPGEGLHRDETESDHEGYGRDYDQRHNRDYRLRSRRGLLRLPFLRPKRPWLSAKSGAQADGVPCGCTTCSSAPTRRATWESQSSSVMRMALHSARPARSLGSSVARGIEALPTRTGITDTSRRVRAIAISCRT